jgi:hypothetical protein
MLRPKGKQWIAIVVIVILSVIAVTAIQASPKSTSTQIDDNHQNMRTLLERLKLKLKDNGGTDFTVTFQFVLPLIQDDTTWWGYPYSNENPDMQRTIGEIGDDYVCFDELAGEGFVTRCTPFSNIVTIGYSDY